MEIFRSDLDLASKMADLDIMEVESSMKDCTNNKQETPELSSRVLRRRKSIIPEMGSKTSNRRVSMKPRKHTTTSISENANRKQIEALYLNSKVKTVSQTLETIYEEPKTDNGKKETLIGGRKVKRQLTFQLGNQYTKEKIKKRRAKIKKLLGNKSFLNRKKIPMHVFLKNIECLELDEPVQIQPIIPQEQDNEDKQ